MSKEDGGPAFPTERFDNTARVEPNGYYGMSLRDWFAGMALQGMCARDMFDAGQDTPAKRAALAYIEADAMLLARRDTGA